VLSSGKRHMLTLLLTTATHSHRGLGRDRVTEPAAR
jgi:hypothetical protein